MALTKLNNKAVANVTSIPVALGDMVLVSSATASSSASIEFSLGNYKEYQFYFIDIHPRTDDVSFQFNLSTDSGSNYNVTKTSTTFISAHQENDSYTSLSYNTGLDLAQSTSYQNISNTSNDADHIVVGYISLFNPSSTTYVKHWISSTNTTNYDDISINLFCAGYGNTTSAINAVQFKMSSGNFDGTIAMFGVL